MAGSAARRMALGRCSRIESRAWSESGSPWPLGGAGQGVASGLVEVAGVGDSEVRACEGVVDAGAAAAARGRRGSSSRLSVAPA